MRRVHNPQMTFGQVDIADIEINLKSRDDIPHILLGLQHIYVTPELRERTRGSSASCNTQHHGTNLTLELT